MHFRVPLPFGDSLSVNSRNRRYVHVLRRNGRCRRRFGFIRKQTVSECQQVSFPADCVQIADTFIQGFVRSEKDTVSVFAVRIRLREQLNQCHLHSVPFGSVCKDFIRNKDNAETFLFVRAVKCGIGKRQRQVIFGKRRNRLFGRCALNVRDFVVNVHHEQGLFGKICVRRAAFSFCFRLL